jgi:hypothetical protein
MAEVEMQKAESIHSRKKSPFVHGKYASWYHGDFSSSFLKGPGIISFNDCR